MRQNEMKQNGIRLPELLAPAGSFEHLKAAVKAGADAVYMGGQQFGARAYADNFTREKLVEALHYAHFYEKRLYLTVNTLMKERELDEQLCDFLRPFYEEGLDGVIVQDMGAASIIRQNFPGMEIHGSTQMTITDVYGARAAARLGMNRVVPARELSLEELRRIKEDTGLELEVFVHGALCYCYSGQCLLSSMYGGRSGNRGRCAQPCRLPYRALDADGNFLACGDTKKMRASASSGGGKQKRASMSSGGGKKRREVLSSRFGNHVLSPKDLCALSVLPSLIAAGMDSLKIEGRMKNVEYVAGVTAIYRKYLNEYRMSVEAGRQWSVSRKDYTALEELYSRTGFTDGYWQRHNGAEMMSTIHPRNLGRQIGRVHKVYRGKIAVEIEKDTVLHPRDVLILPLKEQEEIALTVPEQLQKEGDFSLLNVPGTKGLRPGMEIYRRKNEALSAWIQNDILAKEIKYPVKGEITIKIGEPSVLVLHCRGEEIIVSGSTAEPSSKRPLGKEDIIRQMNKTGGVPFYLDDLQIHLEEDVFLPMSALKELRQKGFLLLKERLAQAFTKRTQEKNKIDRKISLQSEGKSDTVISLNNNKNFDISAANDDSGAKDNKGNSGVKDNSGMKDNKDNSGVNGVSGAEKKKMAVVYDKKMFSFCLGHPFFDSICLPVDFWEEDELSALAEEICQRGKKAFLSLPLILRMDAGVQNGVEKTEEGIRRGQHFYPELAALCESPLWSGIYVHGIGQAQFLWERRERTAPIYAAADFYQWNHRSLQMSEGLFALAGAELPTELSGRECLEMLEEAKKQLAGEAGQEGTRPENIIQREASVYGRVPLMRSAQCVKKTRGCCNHRQEILFLEDRKKSHLPVVSHCRYCYNSIWSDQPKSLLGEEHGEIIKALDGVTFHFFLEEEESAEAAIRKYERWEENKFHPVKGKEADAYWKFGIE